MRQEDTECRGLEYLEYNVMAIAEGLKNDKVESIEGVERLLETHWNNVEGRPTSYSSHPSLVAIRLCDVILGYQAKVPLQIQELSPSVTAYLIRSERRVCVVIDVVLSIGIFGTFLGLMKAFGGSLFDVTFTQFQGGLKESLGSSLMAVLTTIAARFLHTDLIQQQNDFKRRLDHFTKMILPYFRPPEVIVDINEASAELIGDKIGKYLEQSLTGPIDKLQESAGEIHSTVDSFLKAVIRYNASRDEVVEQTQRVITKWTQTMNETQSLFQEIERRYGILTDNLIKAGENVTHGSDSLQRTIELLSATVGHLKHELSGWASPITKLNVQIEKMEEASNKVSSAVSNLDSRLSTLGDNYVRVVTQGEETLQSLQDNGKQISQAFKEINKAFKESNEAFKDTMKELKRVAQKSKSPWRFLFQGDSEKTEEL